MKTKRIRKLMTFAFRSADQSVAQGGRVFNDTTYLFLCELRTISLPAFRTTVDRLFTQHIH